MDITKRFKLDVKGYCLTKIIVEFKFKIKLITTK